MTQFDKNYWEDHWTPGPKPGPDARTLPVNPYLQSETAALQPSTALDAGCGAGTEALWLAEQGWRVTAADISATALARARGRATGSDAEDRIEWVEADLSRWKPARTWDLVVTHYAHSDLGQLDFYQRIAAWVSPGGTLLIVGHLHGPGHHGHHHPEDATATLNGITDLFTNTGWTIEAAYENTRTVDLYGDSVQLRDVIVRARRLL
ncbi:methyltransferase domain-containing protein [Nesterenkonia haasae]|uniref:methyltransferase domain-containing protein n=1 Tax=Nesterenkonia haasae TaxID=2587813 RepID=UPI001390B8CF|nr:class I SAM-dependent methyltransferase [Nesterenkonia haasae]NDK32768.1 class I SAM-dependent methyltransferase [Nesterenkonia haasae]